MDKRKIGKHSRNAGALWEKIITAACRKYSSEGIAEIEKTPEPMRPISKPDASGKFMAVFTKQAQPDFQGTLRGGQSIVFEAKHTDADRMYLKVITQTQSERLDAHYKLGAETYVLASFKLKRFYMIPWVLFRNMRTHFGRQYIEQSDLEKYGTEVFIRDGMLRFLDKEEENETN